MFLNIRIKQNRLIKHFHGYNSQVLSANFLVMFSAEETKKAEPHIFCKIKHNSMRGICNMPTEQVSCQYKSRLYKRWPAFIIRSMNNKYWDNWLWRKLRYLSYRQSTWASTVKKTLCIIISSLAPQIPSLYTLCRAENYVFQLIC